MNLIDADELLKKIEEISHYDDFDVLVVDWDDMIICIDNVTKDAEPVSRGKWIYREYKMSKGESIGYFVCSECGHATWVKEDNYCSYCGTKMDLKEVEE